MAKNLDITILIDIYGYMLTDKQKDALEPYLSPKSLKISVLQGKAFVTVSSVVKKHLSTWKKSLDT